MIKVKNVESKQTPSKLNITATDIAIVDNSFVDEDGNIAEKIRETLDEHNVKTFTLKISVEIDDV